MKTINEINAAITRVMRKKMKTEKTVSGIVKYLERIKNTAWKNNGAVTAHINNEISWLLDTEKMLLKMGA